MLFEFDAGPFRDFPEAPWPSRQFGRNHKEVDMEKAALDELRMPALCTVLLVLLNIASGRAVGNARIKCKVLFPATEGPPEFNRAFRAHANNAEQYPQFLALMWTCAVFVSARLAAWIGLLWIALRVLYVRTYHRGGDIVRFTLPSYACLFGYSVLILVTVTRSIL
jgi:glutathione S-transferase